MKYHSQGSQTPSAVIIPQGPGRALLCVSNLGVEADDNEPVLLNLAIREGEDGVRPIEGLPAGDEQGFVALQGGNFGINRFEVPLKADIVDPLSLIADARTTFTVRLKGLSTQIPAVISREGGGFLQQSSAAPQTEAGQGAAAAAKAPGAFVDPAARAAPAAAVNKNNRLLPVIGAAALLLLLLLAILLWRGCSFGSSETVTNVGKEQPVNGQTAQTEESKAEDPKAEEPKAEEPQDGAVSASPAQESAAGEPQSPAGDGEDAKAAVQAPQGEAESQTQSSVPNSGLQATGVSAPDTAASACSVSVSDDGELISGCLKTSPDQEVLLKLVDEALAAQRCNVAIRLLSSLGRSQGGEYALKYARLSDPNTQIENSCVPKDQSRAVYWYQKALDKGESAEAAQALKKLQ
ncbi:MAG: hypothetical protein IJ228_09870 [Succinivibrio sp.]|nr:hypothetical protein [Succinivibrio sp.]